MSDYTITDIDYYEMDATLKVGDMDIYFQFDVIGEPTLAEAIRYIMKENEELVEYWQDKALSLEYDKIGV